MSRFDALQPDAHATFGRAADVIRAGRPRPDRRPLALAAAFVVVVGACVTPVDSGDLVGFALEWTAYGSVGPGHHTMRALDAVVPAPARFAVETQQAERPSVPADHEWPEDGTWTRVRYTTGTSHRSQAEAWADTMRAVVGAYNIRVEPVVRNDRRSLASAALGRIGQAVSPSDPALSDEDLQAVLDAAVAPHGTGEGSPYHYLKPHVERLNGRRVIMQDEYTAIVFENGVRLWIRPEAIPSQQITFEGVSSDRLLLWTNDEWRPMSEVRPTR